jgi:hypothetical protein
MGCQTSVVLGRNLTWTITTHDPDTGVATDADSPPTYRIYEDETAVPILTGSMALLDAANTAGFYSEQVACTSANGFELNKSYNIYNEATVDSDTGTISYGFTIVRSYASASSAIATAIDGGIISIQRGDSLSVAITDLGDISGRSKLWFTVKASRSHTDTHSIIQIEESAGLVYLNGADASARAANGTITVDDAAAGDITVTLDEVETDDLVATGRLYYDVQVLTAAGAVTTLAMDTARVVADVSRVVA